MDIQRNRLNAIDETVKYLLEEYDPKTSDDLINIMEKEFGVKQMIDKYHIASYRVIAPGGVRTVMYHAYYKRYEKFLLGEILYDLAIPSIKSKLDPEIDEKRSHKEDSYFSYTLIRSNRNQYLLCSWINSFFMTFGIPKIMFCEIKEDLQRRKF